MNQTSDPNDTYDTGYGPWKPRGNGVDIFQEGWGHGSSRPFSTDWLRVWRHRAEQTRAEFRRDLRRARNVFAVRMTAVEIPA